MAVMIPPSCGPENLQTGEGEIFRKLQSTVGTEDWLVIHSLDIADHNKRISGELDFVVIVPNGGVLILEVKGCLSLVRQDGLWYYGTASQPDHRGPFKQASQAMHSLRQRLARQRPDLSNVLFWTAVVFPYITFNEESPEWHQWQIIDEAALNGTPMSDLVRRVLFRARKFAGDKPGCSWLTRNSNCPSAQQCREIAQELRPDFEFFESPRSRVRRVLDEIKSYTQEQFIALDAMRSNPQTLFVGPAGTGKTLLALESVRRSAAQGSKVLFLCFNRILGMWLSDQVHDLTGTTCNTIHGYMLELAGLEHPATPKETSFWEQELPSLAIAKLLEESCVGPSFDEMILDEAQDILCEEAYVDFLDLSLKGGLSSGTWRFFGDFERQDIFSDTPTMKPILSKRFRSVPTYNLTVNCRNAPRIASLASFLGKLDPGYARVLRPDNGLDPEWFFYETTDEQKALLIRLLEQLWRRGYSGDDVVILSMRADVRSLAASINKAPWVNRLSPFRLRGKGMIGYSSIHAFKGMEKPVVIVSDISRIPDDKTRNLVYIAASRALDTLYVLVDKSARQELQQALFSTDASATSSKG